LAYRNATKGERATIEIQKIGAEIRKLSAESDKLILEMRWYPLVLSTALIGAVIAMTKAFLLSERPRESRATISPGSETPEPLWFSDHYLS
jgi:hypothetical protein